LLCGELAVHLYRRLAHIREHRVRTPEGKERGFGEKDRHRCEHAIHACHGRKCEVGEQPKCNACRDNDRSANVDEQAFSCDWLVVMTEKESKALRVGCGRYEWAFEREPELSVTELIITIEVMVILDEALTGEIMRWVGQLDYPWISAAAVTCMPFIPELQSVREYLERELRAK
jgi:hypothetical protein